MSKISGVIQEVITQQRGANTMVDIIVGGQKYGAGLQKFFKGKVGQYVEFDLDDSRGFSNVARNSLKLGEYKGVPEADPREPGATSAATSGYARPAVQRAASSFDTRQDAISRQAASNTAISWMGFLAAQDALPVAAGKAKGAKQEMLDTLRKEYERHFYEHNTGVVWKDISPSPASNPVVAEETVDAGPVKDDPWK